MSPMKKFTSVDKRKVKITIDFVGLFSQSWIKKMSSSPSSSPRSNSNNEGRPRFFDSKAKSMCWAKAETVPGRHPERWRKDAAGNIVCKRFCNCHGCLCFEYDHIVPFSKGSHCCLSLSITKFSFWVVCFLL